jgi:hypothetical protein
MLGVHNDLLGAATGQHFQPERGLLRELVSGMRLEIMDRKNEWIPMPQSQRQIKPWMETLVVDQVGREVNNLPHDAPDSSELLQGLAESGTPEGKQPHAVVQFLFVRVSKAVRQH